jgi:hypothetical protein
MVRNYITNEPSNIRSTSEMAPENSTTCAARSTVQKHLWLLEPFDGSLRTFYLKICNKKRKLETIERSAIVNVKR